MAERSESLGTWRELGFLEREQQLHVKEKSPRRAPVVSQEEVGGCIILQSLDPHRLKSQSVQ